MRKSQNKSKRRECAPDQLAALPFIATRGEAGVPKSRKHQTPRCFWHVKPTGDYGTDCITGEKYALAYLEYAAALPVNIACGCLPSIVRDMPRNLSGIEVGFLSMIDFAAEAGKHEAMRVSAYWDEYRAKRAKVPEKVRATLAT